MDVRSRTRRNLTPMIGGVTALATATGAFAAVAHVAPAGADAGSASVPLGATGLGGTGTFESCSAYFGFGKDLGVLGVVQFDVADTGGDDGATHAVDVDTDVRLVLENQDGEILECVPYELSADDWDLEFGGDPNLPAYPGPGHYAYPSVNLFPFVDDFGPVVEVGYRVTAIPSGDHTLVSPTGVHELDDMFLDPEEVFDLDVEDPRIAEHIATQVSPAAASAYEAALDTCRSEDDLDGTNSDLIDALTALEDLTGEDEVGEEASCFDVRYLSAFASTYLGVFASLEYVEPIRLSPPAAPDAPADPPAAQPAVVEPTFTG